MIILGIDPGTATTGWGIIRTANSKNKKSGSQFSGSRSLSLVNFGCIITRSEDEMGERLLVLRKALQKVIKVYQPDCVVIEQIFFGANSTSALSVGQARGVILLVMRENKVPTFEYTGLEVKLTVANHGRADKKTIQIAVRKHLCVNKLPKPKDQLDRQVFRFRDDAYDAVAAAICHVIKSANKEQQTKNSKKS